MTVQLLNQQLEVAPAVDDVARWDRFVENAPNGHHAQSSRWAAVKAHLGWKATRVYVERDGEIVAGAQILKCPIAIFGNVGYVPKGAVFKRYDERTAAELLAKIHVAARAKRVRMLIIQPADNEHAFADFLQRNNFAPSTLRAIPIGTTRLDLTQPLDTIMANMKSKTRYNIRLAGRKGVTVRMGDSADLPLFHTMLQATAERQGFSDYSLAYFEEMDRQFSPRGQMKLFVAEHEGEPLSVLLAIPFGKTVLFKKGGWSGKGSKLHPNEAMHWAAIQWAKENGYRIYDFEGLDEETVRRIMSDDPPPSNEISSVTRFKLGFGGDVTLNPSPYEYVYNGAVRWAYRQLYPRLKASERLQVVANLFNRG